MTRSLFLICCLVSMVQVAVAQVSLTGVLTDSLGTVITKESSVTLVTKKDMLKVAIRIGSSVYLFTEGSPLTIKIKGKPKSLLQHMITNV